MKSSDDPNARISNADEKQKLASNAAAPQVIRLPELIEFSTDKRIRKKLFEGAQFVGELLCYEPGQSAPRHHHRNEDEFFVILEGHAAILAGDRELDAPAPSLVTVPATVPHDLRNVGNGRLVVIFVKPSRAVSKVSER